MELKRQFKPLRIGKGLLSLLAMFVMLLAPHEAWAEDYGLWVGGVQVTDANATTGITGSNITGTITFNANTNTLTLNGATVTGSTTNGCPIKSELTSLTISILGSNTLSSSDSCTIIRAEGLGAHALTIVNGSQNCLLQFSGERAIRDFSTVTLTGLTWDDDYIYQELDGGKKLTKVVDYYNISEVGNVTLSFYYGLKVAGIAVNPTNASHVLGDDNETVTFTPAQEAQDDNPATPAPATLTLNNADFKGQIVWSNAENLTVEIIGTNEADAEQNYFFQGNANATLTLTTSSTNPGSLHLTSCYAYNVLSGWPSGMKTIYTGGDDDPADYDWWGEPISDQTMLRPNNKYDLVVNGARFCSAKTGFDNEDYSQSYISFNASNNTLTFNNYSINTNKSPFIQNGLSNLNIKLIGDNSVGCGQLFLAKYGDGGNKNVTFKTDDNGSLVITTAGGWYTGHNEPTYQNDLELADQTNNNVRILTIAKPVTYGLSIAGTTVTSANVHAITGNGIQGTVSFAPAAGNEPATLTLNNASITGNIEVSDLSALKINVVGTNTITAGAVSAIKSNLATGACALTFSRADDGDCSLTLSSTDVTVISTGFSGPTYEAMALVAEGEQVDYRSLYGLSDYVNSEYTAVTSATITSYTTYDIIVAGQEVTSLNKNAIAKNQGANNSISYDDVNNVLTFNNVPWNSFNSSYPFIQTSMDLTINLVGTSEPDMGNVLIKRFDNDNETHTLTFTTNESNPGMFIVRGGTFSHEGFNVVYNNHLSKNASGYYSGAGDDPSDWVAVPKYGLTIAGVEVTEANKNNVLGNTGTPSVSFTPAQAAQGDDPATPATLTLNNASITPSGQQASGIVFTSKENLVIQIIGTNVVEGTGGNVAISGPISTTDYSLTIKRGDENDCSLRLESLNGTVVSGFSPYGVAENQGFYNYDEQTSDPQSFAEIYTTTLFAGGHGTEQDPFLIESASDLVSFAKMVNQGELTTEYIKLNKDITEWTGVTGFAPIGVFVDNNNNHPFAGTFDGGGKTISNLEYTAPTDMEYVGLFGYVSGAIIMNLTISGCTFSGTKHVGGIAGYINNTTISSCTVNNSTISCSNTETGDVVRTAGGIVGYCEYDASGEEPTTVSGNTVTGSTTISCSKTAGSGNAVAGAIVGHHRTTTFTNNKYEYSVSVSTKQPTDENTTVSTGYKKRGSGCIVDYSDETPQVEYTLTDVDGITMNNTKKVFLPAETPKGTVMGLEGTYYDYFEDGNDGGILVVPGQMATIQVIPDELYKIVSFSAVNRSTEEEIDNEDITVTNVQENNKYVYTKYEFTMPNADVQFTVGFAFDISNRDYLATTASTTYTGSPLVPTTVTLTPDEGDPVVLNNTSDNTDFTITRYQFDGSSGLEDVDEPINAGTYNVTIEGKGNYTGTTTVFSYKINRADIPSGKYTVPTEKTELMTYTGADQALVNAGSVDESIVGAEVKYYYESITKDEYEGAEYSFPCEPSDNKYVADVPTEKNVGYFAIVYKIFGGDNYNDILSTGLMRVAIDTADIANATIAAIEDETYTGAAITPELTVTFGQTPIELTANTDYTVAYTNNTYVGPATATITGKGNFKGTKSANFNIVNKTLNVNFAENQTWASFYNETEDFNLPDNVMAYIVTEIGQNSVTVSPINYVPKEVPVLLENNTTLTNVTNTNYDDNLLIGVSDEDGYAVSNNSDAIVYALYNNKMMRVTSGTIPAGKCYLVVDLAVAPQLNIVFENDANTTGIDEARSKMEDVRGDVYDLMGRKVQKPSKKGLYINKGHKVVINK